jgi:hypothetical protein
LHKAFLWRSIHGFSGHLMKNEIPPLPTQSRSFLTIALIEMWERFGYYGMQALIVYFMVGGWIGDKVLGTKRSMVLGAGRPRPHGRLRIDGRPHREHLVLVRRPWRGGRG